MVPFILLRIRSDRVRQPMHLMRDYPEAGPLSRKVRRIVQGDRPTGGRSQTLRPASQYQDPGSHEWLGRDSFFASTLRQHQIPRAEQSPNLQSRLG